MRGKLNAISRLVIILTIVGFLLTGSLRFIVIGIITLGIVYVMWKQQLGITKKVEGFSNKPVSIKTSGDTTTNPITLESVLKSDYKLGTPENPFSNMLLPEITEDPERKIGTSSFQP